MLGLLGGGGAGVEDGLDVEGYVASGGLALALVALHHLGELAVGAALGPHSDRLDDDAWRQGVLKCLFTGVPVTAVTGLASRADSELADMVRRYRREREAAGRDVPPDVQVVLDACAAASPHPTES